MSAQARPSVEDIWTWLEEVPDPEIPVISIVDLGIIRHVSWEDDTLVVKVTPTYSGCPATAVINADIETQLRKYGIEQLRLERQLSPAWTTAWLSDTGRSKLAQYGIAPPVEQISVSTEGLGGTAIAGIGIRRAAPIVKCPRCESTDTEKVSQFGSTPCKASYRCKECLEPFDYFKCI